MIKIDRKEELTHWASKEIQPVCKLYFKPFVVLQDYISHPFLFQLIKFVFTAHFLPSLREIS